MYTKQSTFRKDNNAALWEKKLNLVEKRKVFPSVKKKKKKKKNYKNITAHKLMKR